MEQKKVVFQSAVKTFSQLLKKWVYSDHDIFVREMISMAVMPLQN